MDQHCSERLGVVGLETLDHEFHGGIVLGIISMGWFRGVIGNFTMLATPKSVISKTIV